ncbi:MAG: ABC transporter ATP-binding protein [Lachnospiraceae bacterium]|nr:ABC transporter ATP-binding protein [Lachnospiraceae bacterium]
MLQIRDVSKSYGKTKALEHIELKLPRGEIVGLFGENGAGKTTLMKCILGFHAYQGDIFLDGEAITTKNIAKISFATSEHSFIPNFSPKAHRDFYQEHFPKFSEKRFLALMDFFELPMHKPLRSFSMGQKNQFEVIMALCQGAEYILMDEPFAGNDIFNREDFYKVLLGILTEQETVILSTHLIEEVSDFIGRAILLQKGKIVGDVSTLDLDEKGESLLSFIKRTYNYQADRVGQAIQALELE